MVFGILKKYLNGKIYKITNTVNGEIYIGSTHQPLGKRWGQHIASAYDDINIDKPLYKMIREYGYDKFKIELVANFPCISKKSLETEELTYIKHSGTLNIKGNDSIKTIYSKNKNISRKSLNDFNKEFSRELDIYKNMTNISSITINKNKEIIHDLYELYCKTLNIRGLRKESSKKPKSKLAFLLENVLSLTLDDKIKRGVRCSDKILTFYEYQITRCLQAI
jgi:group I intron endonuclease